MFKKYKLGFWVKTVSLVFAAGQFEPDFNVKTEAIALIHELDIPVCRMSDICNIR